MTGRERNIKLFVGNLPFDATEEDLLPLLHGCGQIRYLAVRRDPHTNRSRGFAHVEYKTEPESVEAFKRLIGVEIKGRPLKIDFCDDYYRDKYPDLIAAAAYARDKALLPPNPDPRFQQVPLLPPPPILPPPPPNLGISQPSLHLPHPNLSVPPVGLPVPQPIAIPTALGIPPNLPVHPGLLPPQPHPLVAQPPQPVPQTVQPASAPPDLPDYAELKPEPKRQRSEDELLLQNGKVVNPELFQMIKRMSMLDVYNLVKRIDALMEKSPNSARSLLNSSESMRSALLHAKLLLGYKGLSHSNLKNADVSNVLDYFVIR